MCIWKNATIPSKLEVLLFQYVEMKKRVVINVFIILMCIWKNALTVQILQSSSRTHV